MEEQHYLKIHEFWTTLLPEFQNNAEFLYYFLDIVTVMILIKLIIFVPKFLITNGGKQFKW